MDKETPFEGSVYSATVRIQVHSAKASIRFPCLLSVSCNAHNTKQTSETGKYPLQKGIINFNQTLTLRTQIIHDANTQQFERKEIHVQLNLVSKSRPDEAKLVGRCTLDLASIINQRLYGQPTEFALQFCSVNGALVLSFTIVDKIKTDISISEFDRSYREELSLNSVLRIRDKTPQHFHRRRDLSPSVVNSQHDPIPKKPINTTRQQSAVLSSRVKDQEPRKALVKQKPTPFRSMHEGSKEPRKSVEDGTTPSLVAVKKAISINSDEFKQVENRLHEQISKQKEDMERMRNECQMYKEEEIRLRNQVEQLLQENDLLRVEKRQKGTTAEEALGHTNELRNELTHARDQLRKSKEQIVQLTLSVADLKDNLSQVTMQCGTAESEARQLSEQYGFAMSEKKELQEQLKSTQALAQQSLSQVESLQKDKSGLEESLSRVKEQHIAALARCTNNEHSLAEFQLAVNQQLDQLKASLTTEVTLRNQYEARSQQLTAELEETKLRLKEVEDTKSGIQTEQAIIKEELKVKNLRIQQLQQSLLTCSERIKHLETDNQLLTENERRNREEHLSVVDLSHKAEDILKDRIKKLEEDLLVSSETANSLQQQNEMVEMNYHALKQDFDACGVQIQRLTDENKQQGESILELGSSLHEANIKIAQAEERTQEAAYEREGVREGASLRERELLVRIAELEGEILRNDELLSEAKNETTRVKEELSSREALVERLQEGIRSQVERNQQINARLMTYVEKEDRLKEVVLELEHKSSRVANMLSQQQLKDQFNINIIKQKDQLISQLMEALQAHNSTIGELQQTMGNIHKENEAKMEESILVYQDEITYKDQQIKELEKALQLRDKDMKELEQGLEDIGLSRERLAQSKTIQMSTYEQAVNERDITILELERALKAVRQELEELEERTTRELALREEELKEAKSHIDRVEAEILDKLATIHQLQSSKEERVRQVAQLEEQVTLKEESQFTQMENDHKIHAELRQRIKDLEEHESELTEHLASLNIEQYQQTIQQQAGQIAGLKQQIQDCRSRLEQLPQVERALKIKTIELNSLKYKGSDQKQQSELAVLKDQQLHALTQQVDRLIKAESQLNQYQQRVEELQVALEHSEEERFNVESLSNERAINLVDTREETDRLYAEAALLKEKQAELEGVIQQMLNKQPKGRVKSDGSIRAQNALLKSQLKEMEAIKMKLAKTEQDSKAVQQELSLKQQELDTTKQALVAQEQAKQPPPALSEIKLHEPMALPNLSGTYRAIKLLLQGRQQTDIAGKLFRLIETQFSRHNRVGQVPSKSKELVREFGRLKTQLMRVESKSAERSKYLALIRGCQNLTRELLQLSQDIPKDE